MRRKRPSRLAVGARAGGRRRGGRDGVAVGASAKTHRAAGGCRPDAVLTWNTNAVNAVRASTPTKVQTDGMVYMSYVQAAVYDAVTKLEGRYEPYHDFAFAVAPGRLGAGGGRGGGADDARLLPARPAADGRRRVHGVPRDADRGRRRRRRGRRGGGERPHRLPRRRRPQGGDAELRADRADPARAVAAAAGSGGADAVAGDDAAVPARAGLAVPRRAAAGADEPAVREGPERDRGLRRAQQHASARRSRRRSRTSGSATTSTSTTRRCRASSRSTAWTSSTRRTCSRWARSSRPTRASPASTRSSSTSSGARSRRSGTPTRTATPTRPPTRPGRRCSGCRAIPSTRPSTAASPPRSATRSRRRSHTNHLDVTMPGGQNGSSVLTTTQHFDTVDDIQKQVVDARVWLGFHFRNSVEQGEKLGNDVADWELERYFGPAS